MPKVYVLDTELPSYSFYVVKPEGFHTDEIELTDAELTYIRNTEDAVGECQAMFKAKLKDAHDKRTKLVQVEVIASVIAELPGC